MLHAGATPHAIMEAASARWQDVQAVAHGVEAIQQDQARLTRAIVVNTEQREELANLGVKIASGADLVKAVRELRMALEGYHRRFQVSRTARDDDNEQAASEIPASH